MPFKSIEQQLAESRKVRPTSLSSDAIKRNWSPKIREEALYGARITMRAYLDTLKKRLSEVVGGTLTPQQAEARLKESLRDLGYTPEKPMTIQDLSSSHRIQLIIDTNVKRARSMGQVAASENPLVLLADPAWRLTRTGARKKPRGNWMKRWEAAGTTCGWEGASRREMVALKTSPIWQALAEGAGGFTDTLGSPFPPFAFGSGMAWVNVGRSEWKRICEREGIDDGMDAIREKAKELGGRYEPPSKPQNIDITLPAVTITEVGAGNPLTETATDISAAQTGYSPDYHMRSNANDAIDEAIDAAKGAISKVEAIKSAIDAKANATEADSADRRYYESYSDFMTDVLRELASLEGRVVNYGGSVNTTPIPRDAKEQRAYDSAMERYMRAAEATRTKIDRELSKARIRYIGMRRN